MSNHGREERVGRSQACSPQVFGCYDVPGAATFAVRDVVAVAFLSGRTWYVDFGMIYELTHASSRGKSHHGRAITASRLTEGVLAQLQFYTRQHAVVAQRYREIGGEKFALDEQGRGVLSFSSLEIQDYEPAPIKFVLCQVSMLLANFNSEPRWVPDQASHFLVQYALSGLDAGLGVDDAMSAAAELEAQRVAAAAAAAAAAADGAENATARQQPRPHKAPRISPKILPTNRVVVV